jgi:hypothetical protein
MGTPLEQKSSLEEIRKRFDSDVDRFSNLETGQSATRNIGQQTKACSGPRFTFSETLISAAHLFI